MQSDNAMNAYLVPDAASAEALAAEQQDACVDQMELDCRELQLLAATGNRERDAVMNARARLPRCQPAHPVGFRCQQACDGEVKHERNEPRGNLRYCVVVWLASDQKCLSRRGGGVRGGGGGGGLAVC